MGMRAEDRPRLRACDVRQMVGERGRRVFFLRDNLGIARGSVELGEVTLLFQFVTPPKVAAPLALPEAAKGGFLGTIDRVFTGILAAFLLVEFSGAYALSFRKLNDEEITLDELPDRFVKMVVPEKPKEPPKPAAKAPAPAKKINVADYNRQARDLTNQGRYEDALDLLNQALDQSPKYAQAFNARGFVHLLMLNYTQAVADFSEAIRLKPDYANAFHNRAVALRKLSKTTDAEADEKNASRFMAVVYPVQ